MTPAERAARIVDGGQYYTPDYSCPLCSSPAALRRSPVDPSQSLYCWWVECPRCDATDNAQEQARAVTSSACPADGSGPR